MQQAWWRWWRRCGPARIAACKGRSGARRAEEVGRGRGDAVRVGVRRVVDQRVDALRRVSDRGGSPVPGEAVWVRLVRGSQWHCAGAPCAPRSGEFARFAGTYPPRAGGFVVCLECAFFAGIGAEAAAYAASPVELARGVGGAAPGRHSVDRDTAVVPCRSGPQMRVGAEVPGSGYLPGTSTPAAEVTAPAAA